MNSNQSLTQSEEWSGAKETLARYSTRLKLKSDFHRDTAREISRIQLRCSNIGLVLILSALVTLVLSTRIKKSS